MYKLLIAIDGSDASMQGLRHGLELARSGLGAHFVLANVQTPATLYEMVVAHDAEVVRKVAQEAGAHLLERAAALTALAGVPHETVVVIGEPANSLLELAQLHACDAVILGAQGHGKLAGALMGSVSQQMVQRCPVPVTVVKLPSA